MGHYRGRVAYGHMWRDKAKSLKNHSAGRNLSRSSVISDTVSFSRTGRVDQLDGNGPMRRSGWRRLGIVLSVLWFLVGGFIGNKAALDVAGLRTRDQFENCVAANKREQGEHAPYDQIWTPCWQQQSANFKQNAEGRWWIALAVALVPIPIGWLVGWLLISTGRWIWTGFKAST